jgi:hypothetical protein
MLNVILPNVVVLSVTAPGSYERHAKMPNFFSLLLILPIQVQLFPNEVHSNLAYSLFPTHYPYHKVNFNVRQGVPYLHNSYLSCSNDSHDKGACGFKRCLKVSNYLKLVRLAKLFLVDLQISIFIYSQMYFCLRLCCVAVWLFGHVPQVGSRKVGYRRSSFMPNSRTLIEDIQADEASWKTKSI